MNCKHTGLVDFGGYRGVRYCVDCKENVFLCIGCPPSAKAVGTREQDGWWYCERCWVLDGDVAETKPEMPVCMAALVEARS